MKTALLRFPVCVAVAATVAFGMADTAAWAVSISGESEDDAFGVRGWEARQPFPATRSPVLPSAARDLRTARPCTSTTPTQSRCYDNTPAPAAPAPPPAWTLATTTATGTAPSNAVDVAAALATEFRRIPLDPSGIAIQPARGWTLVNVETIVLTDPTPQTTATTVLGTPVLVRATPARYTWSFGDDSAPLTTTDPGAPWPNHTVSHAFRTAGTTAISLSTEWTGEFQIAGTTVWNPIAGTATTTETAPPLEIRQATNALTTTG